MEESSVNQYFTDLLKIEERKSKLEKSELDIKIRIQQIHAEITNAYEIFGINNKLALNRTFF